MLRASTAPSGPSVIPTTMTSATACIAASVAAPRCSARTPSSTPAPAGRASTRRAGGHGERARGPIRSACAGPRFAAPIAMRISAMCFPTDRSRRCALLHQWCRLGARHRGQERHVIASMDAKSVQAARSALSRPRALRRPSTSRHHGIERVDDYAWLRADNWQAVMRDPARSIPRSGPISKPRTPTRRPSWPTRNSSKRSCSPR